MQESAEQKQTLIVSADFFKQFCHGNKLIVLGRQIELEIKERLRNEHLKLLRDFLSDNTFITSINLSFNKITSEGLETIANILVKKPHIKELILSNNNIDGEGIKYLVQVKFRIGLECFRINGNKLKEEYAKYLIQFLENNINLKYLDLGETDLTNGVLHSMMSVIIKSKLRGLVLSSIIGYNSKPQETAAILQYICTKNNSLTMLYLRKLQLSDGDVETICSGLNFHLGLELLDLSCNNISDIGGGFIIRYIQRSQTIQGLFLGHNRLSDGTSYSLSTTVPTSKISMLDVSYNIISDNGLLHLLHILQHTCGLCILVWGNEVGPECCAKLKTLYELRKSLTGILDITVQIDKYHKVNFDYNPELDTFRKNYYSVFPMRTEEKEAARINRTFQFHKIVVCEGFQLGRKNNIEPSQFSNTPQSIVTSTFKRQFPSNANSASSFFSVHHQ